MGGKKQLFYSKGFFKAKVWAIAEAFTFVLNCVVISCVMNQSLAII
jgi:hypothetical protein